MPKSDIKEAEVVYTHKEVSLNDINASLQFIKHAMNSLTDADDRKAFAEKLAGMLNATEMVEGNNKKATALLDVASQYANQVAFRLFVEGNLSESLLDEFRSLVPMKETISMAQEYSKESQAQAQEITELQRKYMDERKEFEIFQAVVMGLSKEEAQQKQAAYEAQKAQALHNTQA